MYICTLSVCLSCIELLQHSKCTYSWPRIFRGILKIEITECSTLEELGMYSSASSLVTKVSLRTASPFSKYLVYPGAFPL